MSTKTSAKWPVMPGTYQVGDPSGPVAVCALTSEKLMGPLAAVSGVAIRFLLLCGRDSALFKPGQSLVSLSEKGIDEKKRIIDAAGYDPVLPSIDPAQVKQFRKQVEVIDWTGEEDLQALSDRVKSLADRNPGVFESGQVEASIGKREEFESIRLGSQREPLIYDPKGYFVITIEPESGEIVLRHYLPDHTPAHEMRGRGATSMLLGLLRDGLVTQLSHAGYLGEELAKAQTALQFGMRYDQDRPLRLSIPSAPAAAASTETQAPPKPAPIQAFTLKQYVEVKPGTLVEFFTIVTDVPRDQVLGGFLVEIDESGVARTYSRTGQRVEIEWGPGAKFAMGGAEDLVVGAILRVYGKLGENHLVHAEGFVVLTRVAKIT